MSRHPVVWFGGGIGATLAIVVIVVLLWPDPPIPAPPPAKPESPVTSNPPPSAAKPVAEAAPAKVRATDLIERFRRSVVWIAAERGELQSTGSGFVVRKDGVILTNDHVVRQARRIRVGWERGAGFEAVDADVVLRFPDDDLAVLRVSHRELVPVAYAAESAPLRGCDVVALGFPLSDAFGQDSMSITRGIVTGIGQLAAKAEVVRTDVQVNPGNSGGPLVDVERGRVVGVIFARGNAAGDASGYGFAIPMKRVLSLIPEIGGESTALDLRAERESRGRLDSEAWREELQKTRPYYRSLSSPSAEVRAGIPIETLIRALQDSESSIRSLAARAIEERKTFGAPARDVLIRALQDPSPVVRMDVATALAAISPGDPKVLEVLLPAMESPSAQQRETAATAIGRLGNKEPRTLLALAKGLRPEDGRVFDASLRALDHLKPEGHRAAFPVIVERLEAALRTPDARVPVSLVEAVGLCGKQDAERAAPLLLRVLKERGATLGHACSRAFGELGPGVLPHVKGVLKDREPELRQFGVSTLGRLRPLDAECISSVEALSGDPDPRVRSAVLSSMAGFLKDGARVSLERILRFSDDPSGSVRVGCAVALGTLPNLQTEGMRALGRLLGDADLEVRRAAIDSIRLQPRGAGSMMKEIGALLADRDLTIRRVAVEILGNMGPPAKEYNKALVNIAENPLEDQRIRMSAVDALIRINPEVKERK